MRQSCKSHGVPSFSRRARRKARSPRNLKRRTTIGRNWWRSRIFRDDGTHRLCREESAVVSAAQKWKAIPVAYVSDSSSGTKTLNIEERLVTWRSYFFPPLSSLPPCCLSRENFPQIYFSRVFPSSGSTDRTFHRSVLDFIRISPCE